ncbi:MAG: response regulator [Anaerolineae bacterium]|nr:response regulator [Anaerolineae bacterium]
MTQKRILIVDDEESILTVLKNSLKKVEADYQVVTVKDGFTALDQLRLQPFDLVISDYNMADMDGLELLEAIHYLQPTTPLIMITAYGSDTLQAEAHHLHVYRYLTKPLDISAFRQIVQEALGDRPVSRPKITMLSDEQYHQLSRLLESLLKEVSAGYIFLADAHGRTIAAVGRKTDLPMEQIASLLSSGIATLAEAGRALDGEADAISLTYREGKNEYLYAVNIGQQFLLILMIKRGPYSSRLGSVWYYAQQTAVSLRDTLSQSTCPAPQQIFEQAIDRAFEDELDKLFTSGE